MNYTANRRSLLVATFTAVTLSLSAFAFAQSGEEQHRPRMERMFEDLGLDAGQTQAVEEIMRASREQHEALREATHAQLAEVLTADQMEKLESGRRSHGEGPKGKPPCDNKRMPEDAS